MYRIKAIVEYDGSGYMGFQVQDDLPTIELELEKAISKVTNDRIDIYASGRTDKGVHAIGQVIHFDTDKDISEYGWKKAINSFLPGDIRIVSVERVDNEFHSRFSAKSKEYHYLVKTNNFTVFDRLYYANYYNLDIEAMKDAIKEFIGVHNFKGFCSASVDPRKEFVKEIYDAHIDVEGDVLRFVFKGSGFLKYQIRRMMGLILEIGLKKDTKNTILEVFDKLDPEISHMKAPAEGLYLVRVNY